MTRPIAAAILLCLFFAPSAANAADPGADDLRGTTMERTGQLFTLFVDAFNKGYVIKDLIGYPGRCSAYVWEGKTYIDENATMRKMALPRRIKANESISVEFYATAKPSFKVGTEPQCQITEVTIVTDKGDGKFSWAK